MTPTFGSPQQRIRNQRVPFFGRRYFPWAWISQAATTTMPFWNTSKVTATTHGPGAGAYPLGPGACVIKGAFCLFDFCLQGPMLRMAIIANWQMTTSGAGGLDQSMDEVSFLNFKGRTTGSHQPG